MSQFAAEVLLIRHAESDFNLNYPHLIGGRSNESPLTPTGIEQAKTLGRSLLTANILPTHIHVSPAVRTLMTAQYSLAEMGIDIDHQVHDALQEMGHGEYEGRDREATYTAQLVEERARLGKDFKLPTGESMNDTGWRMQGWLNEAIEPAADGACHFVYTHGMAIRCLIGAMHGWSAQEIFQKYITPNVSITKLVYDGEKWQTAYYAKSPETL